MSRARAEIIGWVTRIKPVAPIRAGPAELRFLGDPANGLRVADLGGLASALIGEAEAFGFGNCYFGSFGHIDILLRPLYALSVGEILWIHVN